MSGQSPRDFVYVHTDIPDGMTICEWRAYEAEAADNTAAAMAELQEQFDELVEIVGALTERLDPQG